MEQALRELNQVEEAVPHFRKSLALYPELDYYRLSLVDALMRRARDEAIAIFREDIRNFTAWADPYKGLAAALLKQGDWVVA